jgi:hypothetical protein
VTALVDLQRLARVCGLFGSDHDGEALAAARQAAKIGKKVGLTWEELLLPSTRQRSEAPSPQGKRMIEFYSPMGPAFGRHSSNERGSLRLVRSHPT